MTAQHLAQADKNAGRTERAVALRHKITVTALHVRARSTAPAPTQQRRRLNAALTRRTSGSAITINDLCTHGALSKHTHTHTHTHTHARTRRYSLQSYLRNERAKATFIASNNVSRSFHISHVFHGATLLSVLRLRPSTLSPHFRPNSANSGTLARVETLRSFI